MNFEKQSTFGNRKVIVPSLLVVAFALLFHKAGLGLNVGLFAVLATIGFFILFPQRFREWRILANVGAICIAAISAAYYGTWETILWCVLSLSVMAHLLYFPNRSLLFFEVKLAYNLLGSPMDWFTNIKQKDKKETSEAGIHPFTKILLFVIVPFLFVLLFITLYRFLNPIFDEAASQFFGWLDFSILVTVLIGGLVTLLLFRPTYPSEIMDLEASWSNIFPNTKQQALSPKQRIEYQSGVILFGILNLVLLLFIITDIAFVRSLVGTKGLNYSAFVHGGIGILILSISIASGLVLFYFRHVENAHRKKTDLIKIMALIWILLNLIVLFTTASKNFFYIDNQGLTLKRIGVYIYLTLAFTGLSLVFIKVYFAKTNAFLFRQLYVVFYAVLTLNLPIDWSHIITKRNIERNILNEIKLDYNYMLRLDARVLPLFERELAKLHLPEHKQTQFNQLYNEQVWKLKTQQNEWRESVFAQTRAAKHFQTLSAE